MTTPKKARKVKAWAIQHKETGDLWPSFYEDKVSAENGIEGDFKASKIHNRAVPVEIIVRLK
jgi:hypothetical protein